MPKKNAKLRLLKVCITVPIYDAAVWLVVSSDLLRERKKFEYLFGPVPDCEAYDALCSYGSGHSFALFFTPNALTTKIIAHEIFHLTHRILDWVGANFDSQHHEQGALLHGWLTAEVLETLRKKKLIK